MVDGKKSAWVEQKRRTGGEENETHRAEKKLSSRDPITEKAADLVVVCRSSRIPPKAIKGRK